MSASVNYCGIIPYMTNAIQELSKKNDKNVIKNKKLEEKNKKLENENKLIMKQLEEMNQKLKYCLDKIN